MDFANMTMTQKKMLGAAAALVLFIISMFLKWVGEGDFGASGWKTLPSSFIFLVMAAAAAAILIMGALDREIPIPVPPFATAFYLASIPFWVTLAIMLDGDYPSKKFGLFIGLLSSAAASALTLMVGRETEG